MAAGGTNGFPKGCAAMTAKVIFKVDISPTTRAKIFGPIRIIIKDRCHPHSSRGVDTADIFAADFFTISSKLASSDNLAFWGENIFSSKVPSLSMKKTFFRL